MFQSAVAHELISNFGPQCGSRARRKFQSAVAHELISNALQRMAHCDTAGFKALSRMSSFPTSFSFEIEVWVKDGARGFKALSRMSSFPT